MIALLTGRLGRWLMGGAAIGAAALAVWWLIDSRARIDAENDRLRDNIETRERIDNADPDFAVCDWPIWLRGDCQR